MTIDHLHALPPGTRLEEFRLDVQLGAGGFGITYRAHDELLDKVVAVKEYLPRDFATRTAGSTVAPISDADARDYQWGLTRFLDEARTLARFDHPHLNKVRRFFEANGTAYMVLEYIHGETLAARLSREQRLSEAALLRLLEEVLSGLADIHEAGYVHRDIKPGNLMLREEDGSAVLLDFGAARQAVGQRSKSITSILTPGYAPIEQYDSKADDVGPWSDIYALGMVAYKCVSGAGDGELPDAVTRGRSQRKGGTDLASAAKAGKGRYSAKLLEAIDWAIEVDEEARPQGVGEWQEALAGGKSKARAARTVRKPAVRTAKAQDTERAGMSWSTIALTAVIVVLLGASAWQGWRLYRGMPEVSVDNTATMVESQAEPETASEPDTQTPGTAAEEDAGPDASVESAPVVSETEMAASAASATPAPQPTKAPPVEEDEVTRMLAAAEADIKARRLTSPVGNNAWEKYQRVLELAPANPEAVRGMERVMGSYMDLFGAALEQEDFDQAESYLARIRDLHPDSPMLLTGNQRLEVAQQARAERLAERERQRQAEEAARQAELERQGIAKAIEEHWAAFEAAMQRDEWDRAGDRLNRVRKLDPEEPGLAAGERRLSQAREAGRQKARQYAGELVAIPAGSFRMGDLSGEGGDAEKPVHSVTVPAFSLGKYEVTVGQFRRFVEATGYRTEAERNTDGNQGCIAYTGDNWASTPGTSWRNPGFSVGDKHPVVCVSWHDAQAYVKWLNGKAGGDFRLPTEAEWEYAARARSTTKYHFGNAEAQLCRYANHADGSTDFNWKNESCSDGVGKRTAEVGRYQPNSFGLYDMHGNVWEWVEDCWNDSYAGAPSDGRAWTSGDCGQRVIRGGAWGDNPGALRSADRGWSTRSTRLGTVGFRLAQDK